MFGLVVDYPAVLRKTNLLYSLSLINQLSDMILKLHSSRNDIIIKLNDTYL